MKCPGCSKNHKRSYGMTCGCGYKFALDPKVDKFADGRILAAARRASSNGTHYFTFPQMVTAARNLQRQSIGIAIFGGIMLLVAGALISVNRERVIFAEVLVLFGIVSLFSYALGGSFNAERFQAALKTYEQAKRPLKFLLRNDGPLRTPPQEWVEGDIYDYGVEGILIVSRQILFDLLVLNGLHTTSRILIVSEGGYPNYIADHVNQVLKSQPDVPVFILHDADAQGAAMVSRLKRSDKFQLYHHAITDLGLHSQDLARMPNLRRFAKKDKVQIDYLNWGRLSAGIGVAISASTVLVDVIGRDPDSYSSFG